MLSHFRLDSLSQRVVAPRGASPGVNCSIRHPDYLKVPAKKTFLPCDKHFCRTILFGACLISRNHCLSLANCIPD